MDYPLPQSKSDRAPIVLRKAITEALEDVLLRLPELFAKALDTRPAKIITKDDSKIVQALKDLALPEPKVTVNVPPMPPGPESVELSKEATAGLQEGYKAIEKAVLEATETLQKQQTPEQAILSLLERMAKDKSLWFNVRLTDGKKFIDKFAETMVVSMRTADLNKESTQQQILSALQNLSVTVNAGDIEIGAVELKDGSSDNRATIGPDGAVKTSPIQHNVTVSGISGTVTTSGIAQQPVRVDNFPATQPVSIAQTVVASGGVFLQPNLSYKTARFGLSATGTVVSAVSNKRIKVYGINFAVSAAVGAMLRDGGAGQSVPGLWPFAANGGLTQSVAPPAFLFATSPGNSLDMVLTASGAAGLISYWDDDAT